MIVASEVRFYNDSDNLQRSDIYYGFYFSKTSSEVDPCVCAPLTYLKVPCH